MNLLAIFKRPEPPHTQVRFIAATKAENALARQKRADVRMELEIMNSLLTDKQRAEARERGGRRGKWTADC